MKAEPKSLSRRTLLRLLGAGVLASVVGGGPLRLLFALREPMVMFPPVPLPVPNGYDVCKKAIGLLKNADHLSDAFRAEYAAPTAANRHDILSLPQKQAVLRDNAAALQAIQAALALPYQEPPLRDGVGNFPHLSPLRNLARLCVVQGDVLREGSDFTGAVTAYLNAARLGTKIVRGGPLITRLVGIATEAIGRRPLWKHLHTFDAASAKAGARRMESIIAAHVPLAETWAEEKYFGQAALLLSFRDTNKMASELFPQKDEGFSGETPPASLWTKIKVLGVYAKWGKTGIMDEYARYMDDLTANSRLPYAQRKQMVLPQNPLTVQVVEAFQKADFKTVESSKTQNALLCAALALQSFRAERGAYPATLAEIVSGGYVSRIPADPFSPAGNGSLSYRRVSNQEMVLWSVGPDGKNNNGTPITDTSATGNARYFVTAESRGDIVAGINIF